MPITNLVQMAPNSKLDAAYERTVRMVATLTRLFATHTVSLFCRIGNVAPDYRKNIALKVSALHVLGIGEVNIKYSINNKLKLNRKPSTSTRHYRTAVANRRTHTTTTTAD